MALNIIYSKTIVLVLLFIAISTIHTQFIQNKTTLQSHPIVGRKTIAGAIVNATLEGLRFTSFSKEGADCSRNTEIFVEHSLDVYDNIGW